MFPFGHPSQLLFDLFKLSYEYVFSPQTPCTPLPHAVSDAAPSIDSALSKVWLITGTSCSEVFETYESLNVAFALQGAPQGLENVS